MKRKLFGQINFIKNRMEFEQDKMFRLESEFFVFLKKRFIQVVTIAETPFISIRSDNRCDPATEILCPRKKLNGI